MTDDIEPSLSLEQALAKGLEAFLAHADRTEELLERIEMRLETIEEQLGSLLFQSRK